MHVDEYTMSELVSSISHIMNTIKPTIVYLPHKGDVHSDHRKIFEARVVVQKFFGIHLFREFT